MAEEATETAAARGAERRALASPGRKLPLAALCLVAILAGLAWWANFRSYEAAAGHWVIEAADNATGPYEYPWKLGQAMVVSPRGAVTFPGLSTTAVLDRALLDRQAFVIGYAVNDPGIREPARLDAVLSPDGTTLTITGPRRLRVVARRVSG